MKKNFLFFVASLFIPFLFFPGSVNADSAAVPSFVCNIVYQNFTPATLQGITKPIKLIYAEELACSDEDCSNFNVITTEDEPQNFFCNINSCSSYDYANVNFNNSSYRKLIFHFFDKTRESQVFKVNSSGGNAYNVIVTADDLVVSDASSPLPFPDMVISLLRALTITLLIELFVSYIYLLAFKKSKKILIYVFLANLISLPIVWALVYLKTPLIVPAVDKLIFAEIFAVVFEALFIHFLNRKNINLIESFGLCVIMNMASLFIGQLIIGWFFGYFINTLLLHLF
jgi:hypothetical protein